MAADLCIETLDLRTGSSLDLFSKVYREGAFTLCFFSPAPCPGRRSSWLNDSARWSIFLTDPVEKVVFDLPSGEMFNWVEDRTRGSSAERKKWLPFTGGAAGIVSYETLQLFENVSLKKSVFPAACWGVFDDGVVVDELDRKAYIFSRHKSRLRKLRRRIETGATSRPPLVLSGITPGVSPAQFRSMVIAAKNYIRQGDIYQVNLSQPFFLKKENSASSWELFKEMVRINPSPFSFYFSDGEELECVSVSPERLFLKAGDIIETRPIAGTYPPRGKERFLRDTKEKAEHIMLVDLERNDLGRIAVPGSISVSDMFAVEEYSHLIHLVSRVVAKPRKGIGIREVFRAIFPGGTITGCPKVRAMEIISELEPFARGFYTGSCGYVCRTGRMDFNIIIRTLNFIEQNGVLNVGAGIVADSRPMREYRETIRKAAAFFEAVAGTRGGRVRAGGD